MAICKNEPSIIYIHIHKSPHTKEGRNVEACMNHNLQTAAVSNKMANGVFCGAIRHSSLSNCYYRCKHTISFMPIKKYSLPVSVVMQLINTRENYVKILQLNFIQIRH